MLFIVRSACVSEHKYVSRSPRQAVWQTLGQSFLPSQHTYGCAVAAALPHTAHHCLGAYPGWSSLLIGMWPAIVPPLAPVAEAVVVEAVAVVLVVVGVELVAIFPWELAQVSRE